MVLFVIHIDEESKLEEIKEYSEIKEDNELKDDKNYRQNNSVFFHGLSIYLINDYKEDFYPVLS
jgi:hypothetical protein